MRMTSTARITAGCLWAAWALLCSWTATAADRCRPLQQFATPQALEVVVEDGGTPVWLEAKVANALKLSMSPDEFGLRPDAATMVRLERDHAVKGRALGRNVVQDDRGTLVASETRGRIQLRANGRRVSADVVDREVRDASGRRLAVAPSTEGLDDFVIAKGSEIRAVGASEIVVEPGSTLVWRPQLGQPLRIYLLGPAQFAETVAADAGHVSKVTPAFAPANGKLRVTVDAPGIDLRMHAPAFCFMAAAGGGEAIAASADFVSQDGDRRAVYDLRLAPDAAAMLRDGSSLLERIRGVPARLRVIAFAENRPAVDQWLDVRVTSVTWSAAVGFGLLALLFAVCAASLRTMRPGAVFGTLIRQPTGRYSLSNLQVLLWTLLVLFAYAFAWISTGELFALSSELLGLLGIAGGSSVLARGVEKLDPATAAATAAPVAPGWDDLVKDKDGNFDLLRFQMLGFTLFAWLYSLVSVLRSDGLPELPQTLYWLMGISNATYVAGKVPGVVNTQAAPAETPASAVVGADLPKERLTGVQKVLQVPTTGVLDVATRDAVKAYKLKNGLYPVNAEINRPLLDRLGA